jgi:hypothetical protein
VWTYSTSRRCGKLPVKKEQTMDWNDVLIVGGEIVALSVTVGLAVVLWCCVFDEDDDEYDEEDDDNET